MARPGENFDGLDFLLPDLGEGLEEAEVVEWSIEEGQAVEEGDALALIETGKAQTEVLAPRDGVIEKLLHEPGVRIEVGKAFVTYAATNGEVTPKPEPAKEEPVKEEPEAERDDGGTVVGHLSEAAAESGKPLATPAVRKLAKDKGVDLDDVAGTGMGGRIVARDVEAAATRYRKTNKIKTGPAETDPASAKEPVAPPEGLTPESFAAYAAAAEGDSVHIPFRGMRRTIADRLRHSVDQAVHFTVMDEADVTALDANRRRLVQATGQKISLLPFVCAAVARVLSGEIDPDFIRLNSTVDDQLIDIRRHRKVNLGLAVDTSDGLMVPVIRDVRRLGVMEIGERIASTAAACRSRSVKREDLSGSTFTISNFGSYAGGRFATPILNYPEAAILAVGRAREGVVVRNGMMGVGKLLPLSLTCDHRVVDGGTAVGGLNAILQLLQTPEKLLPES